jgi:hypothetical protein
MTSESDKVLLSDMAEPSYLMMIEPHAKALAEHVYGSPGGPEADAQPCWECTAQEACEARGELLRRQDEAVLAWLASQNGQLTWGYRVH